MEKDLLDWILRHIRQKDVFFKKIEAIEESGDSAIVKYKDHSDLILAYSVLDEGMDKIMATDDDMIVAVLNSKQNIDVMVKNWDSLAKKAKLRFYFINPKADDKWIISPHTHHKITERRSLRKGIVSLSQNIPLLP